LKPADALYGYSTPKTRRHSPTRSKLRNETFNGSPGTHTTARQTREDVDGSWGADVPGLLESADPALHAIVVTGGDASGWVETLAGQGGGLLDDPAEIPRIINVSMTGHGGFMEGGEVEGRLTS
jgi:hypothetical protein